eukprot:CAMPEP_0201546942 /NCGR_PEP_ID=MMETSP0173_2-20130828/3320_1 /ASSEMBLY_ACC=CAM_ASM_000268 /TAXON_ID=218659 /ORGANISM="Vexillifera sp., Strain DIVA3 564/2" /LENGTH=220 /DNA_ID=CAMNT_0047955787 /DNA_START=321 /DNA_END=983 /DNA_ORIENTATION=-
MTYTSQKTASSTVSLPLNAGNHRLSSFFTSPWWCACMFIFFLVAFSEASVEQMQYSFSPILSLVDLETEIEKYVDTLESEKDFHLEDVQDILARYEGDDWKAFESPRNDTYNRITVSVSERDIFDIHVLTWNINQVSPIHDHADQGCIFRTLRGQLVEDRFKRQEDGKLDFLESQMLVPNVVGSITNEVGYHRVGNLDTEQVAVSLHIYSPAHHKTTYFD